MTSPLRRHALDARPQGERRAGALGGGDDGVVPMLKELQRSGEGRIRRSSRLDAATLAGIEVAVDIGDERRLIVGRQVMRLVNHDHQESMTPIKALVFLPVHALHEMGERHRLAARAVLAGPFSSPSFFLVDSGNTLYAMCRIWSTAFGASA